MAFTQKLIQLQIQLATNSQTNQPNTFAGTSSSAVVIDTDVRKSVRIQSVGSPIDSSAQVKVWGLSPSLMTQLATLGLNYNIVPHNVLTIKAGDGISGLSTVYSGTIWSAYGDYSAQPDVPMILECQIGGYETVAPASNSSFTSPTDAAQVMQTLATQMGFGFENSRNVKVTLSSAGGGGPIFRGSYYQQAMQCAEQAHIQWGILNGQDGGLTLAIWPWNGTRKTPNPPLIAPETGLISYPSFTPNGIVFKTLFNPLIAFGGTCQVASSILTQILGAQQAQNPAFLIPPNSTWGVNRIDLALDSLLPNGEWSSNVTAWNPNYNQSLPLAG